ncbi:hypothetical protein [Halobacillus sp. H74]|uniref:hypothetical protein n=1 Tax=Halobacillus sp. H74 TaxID=3457436 RepID=UPI003FCCD932
MMKKLHESLLEARKKVLEQNRLHRELSQLDTERKALQDKEQVFLKKLNEEKEDVEKLKRMSLTNIFVTLTGKKEERIEQEEREAVEARLKWLEAHNSIKDIEQEMEAIQSRKRELGETEVEYEALYRRKKQYIIQNGEEKGERLLEISEQRSQIQAELIELEEAITAGKEAKSSLEDASKSLSSAENWGALDMVGGGLLTTAVKHSRIDDADSAIHNAQRHLRKFANEIEDLGDHYHVEVEISGGWTVADYFFDGLIVDWFVQNRIQSSHEEVREIREKTHQALLDLESLQRQFNKEDENLKAIQDEMVGV